MPKLPFLAMLFVCRHHHLCRCYLCADITVCADVTCVLTLPFVPTLLVCRHHRLCRCYLCADITIFGGYLCADITVCADVIWCHCYLCANCPCVPGLSVCRWSLRAVVIVMPQQPLSLELLPSAYVGEGLVPQPIQPVSFHLLICLIAIKF